MEGMTMNNMIFDQLLSDNAITRFMADGTFDACLTEGEAHENPMEQDGCADDKENSTGHKKAPLIGWLGGAGYLITLFIILVNHMELTKLAQLKILLIWIVVDLVVNMIRYVHCNGSCQSYDPDMDEPRRNAA